MDVLGFDEYQADVSYPDASFVGGGMLVWACLQWYVLESLHVVVPGKLNADAYMIILDNKILRTLCRFYGMDECYLQDDNDSCYVSAFAK